MILYDSHQEIDQKNSDYQSELFFCSVLQNQIKNIESDGRESFFYLWVFL